MGLGLGDKMATSRRAHTNEYSPVPLPPVLVPTVSHFHSLLSQETPPAPHQDQQVCLVQAPMKSLLFPWVPVHTRPVHTLQMWHFYFPQSYGVPAIKPHWPSKPSALGPPPPDARPPGWEACCGAQNSLLWENLILLWLLLCLWL